MNEFLRRILMLPEQASTIARDIDYLHYFIILTTMFGAVAVALAVIFFLSYYREGTGREHDGPRNEDPGRSWGGIPVWLEVSVVGGLLALFTLWWVIGFRQFVHIQEPPPNSMTVYAVGKQWMWSFAYPNGSGSNGVLYVPQGRPVKLVMTSRDVIHSFYVPAFRVKQDLVPGMTTVVWFEAAKAGSYQILCTEYCGASHSTMRGEVVVLAPEDYDRQLAGLAELEVSGPRYAAPSVPGGSTPTEPLSLAAMGERVAANAGCLRCHTPDGTPHIGPTWAGLYGAEIPLQGGGRVTADDGYLTASMMDPLAMVHLGFEPVMPSYQGRLTAAQVGALVEYIRSLRDQPREQVQVPLPLEVPGDVPVVQPLPDDPAASGTPGGIE